MIDMHLSEAYAAGTDVWCDRAEEIARTADGFCQFCGSTEHEPIEDDEDDGCEGHESLDGAHMGETVYCDGTCRP